jgi:hypothetical protein
MRIKPEKISVYVNDIFDYFHVRNKCIQCVNYFSTEFMIMNNNSQEIIQKDKVETYRIIKR